MASCRLLFAAVWWVALLTGRPVLVTIDAYGEASVEIALWFLLGPVMLFGFYPIRPGSQTAPGTAQRNDSDWRLLNQGPDPSGCSRQTALHATLGLGVHRD